MELGPKRKGQTEKPSLDLNREHKVIPRSFLGSPHSRFVSVRVSSVVLCRQAIKAKRTRCLAAVPTPSGAERRP